MKNDPMRNVALSVLAIAILPFIFLLTRPHSPINQRFPAQGTDIKAMSVGFAQSYYGLKGFKGYLKIQKLFIDSFIFRHPYGHCSYDAVTETLQTAMRLPAVAEEGYHYLFADAGVSLIYQWAFRLFGYRGESLYFFMFGILALSTMAFLAAFYRDRCLLFLLNLFLGSFLAMTFCAAYSSVELQTIFQSHFLPVFCILPALHLLFASLFPASPGARWVGWVTLGLQAVVLNVIASARSCGWVWLVGPVLLVALAKKRKPAEVTFIPAAFFIVVSLLYQGVIQRGWDPVYEQAEIQPAHTFWHNFFLGLSAHPDFERRYGYGFNDYAGMRLVEKKAPEYGYRFHPDDQIQPYGAFNVGVYPADPQEIILTGTRYSRILKDEYFRLLRQDPLFVITSYFYKIPDFFKVYFSNSGGEYDHLGAPEALRYPPLVLFLLVAAYLAREDLLASWHRYQRWIGLLFSVSLVTPLATLPVSFLIADSGLIFSMLLYSLALSAALFVYRRLSMGMKQVVPA